MKIALLQIPRGNPDWMLDRVAAAAQDAAQQGAALLVLSGRSFDVRASQSTEQQALNRDLAASAPVLDRLAMIARERGIALLAGIVEKERDSDREGALLFSRRGKFGGVVRCVTEARNGAVVVAAASRGARSILRIGRVPVAIVVGDAWLSTGPVRVALTDRAQPRALVVITADQKSGLIQRARELAASDAVTVIVCNAAAPDGCGSSCVVMADDEIALAFGEGEQLAVVDLVRPRPSPVEGLADRVKWSDLPSEERAQVKQAVVQLIARSQDIEIAVFRQGTGRHAQLVAHREIAALWDDTYFAELWRRLDMGSRDELITELKSELGSFQQLYDLARFRLTFIEAPSTWATKGPVVRTAAGGAIFSKAVRSELWACLESSAAPTRRSLRRIFEAKANELGDQPASVFYLTFPYLQAVARNFLRDRIRETVERAAASHRPAVGPDPTLGLGLLDFDADLSPLQRDLLRLRFEDAAIPVAAMARKLSRSPEEVERALLDLAQLFRAHLGASGQP